MERIQGPATTWSTTPPDTNLLDSQTSNPFFSTLSLLLDLSANEKLYLTGIDKEMEGTLSC